MKKRVHQHLIKYLLGVGMVFMCNGLFAQQQPQAASAQDRAAKELEMLKKDLTLTADQEAKIKPILVSYAEKEQQQRETAKEDKEANKTQRQQLRQQKDADLKAILTADQYQKLQDKKKEQHGGDGHGHGGNH